MYMINEDNSSETLGLYNPLCGLFSLTPKQFAILSTVIGIVFVDYLDIDMQNSLGNFIVNVGQALLTSAAQGQLISNKLETENKNQIMLEQIQSLKKQVIELEAKIRNS